MILKHLQTKILILFTIITLSTSHSLPIYRRQNKTAQQLKQSGQCGTVGPNNSTVLGFGNCFQNIYYINIAIGTPSQILGVQFDTGSNILWVPTQAIQNVTPIFNTSQSITFTNTNQVGGVQYVDGSGVSGTYGTDIFQIQGSVINIRTTYLWITQESISFPAQIQGLVGMGFTTTPNFLDVAYKNGQIKTPVFALQLKDQTQTSSIYYNEIPQYISNETIFVPVYGNNYWSVQVYQVEVGGIDMTEYASNVAVIDSGTSYFYINQQLYYNIVETYFTNCQTINSILYCSCSSISSWPEFNFTFQGVQVSISPLEYAGYAGGNVCTANFGSISGFSQILLGDIFFRSYIITFDKLNQQIGFNGIPNDNFLPVFYTTASITIMSAILLVWMIVLILFGIIVCCCIQCSYSSLLVKPLVSPLVSPLVRPNLQSLELAGNLELEKGNLQERFL